MKRNHCIYIDNCPMVRYFNRMARIVYQEMYCQRNYTECVRYKLKAAEWAVKNKQLPPYTPQSKDTRTPKH